MTDGEVFKSLFEAGKDTWEIHKITGVPESRVYNSLSAYRKERYSVHAKVHTARNQRDEDKVSDPRN